MTGLALGTAGLDDTNDSRLLSAGQSLGGYIAGSASSINRSDLGHSHPSVTADVVVAAVLHPDSFEYYRQRISFLIASEECQKHFSRL